MQYPQFLNALSPLQWAVATAVPIGVVALYFLKLRRKPVEVPSTFLWQKSVEDLHVNSLFQRLRRNLLLFLQLLMLAFAILALARPAWLGGQTGGQRHVIVMDSSASMSATDVEPNRLEAAKSQARTEIIDKMTSDDSAMIIEFNDSASVVAQYTSNRQLLRERLDSIQPTNRTSNLRGALDIANGLANQQTFKEGVEDIGTPKLHIFTDGGFPDVADFSLGSLEPHFYPVGKSSANAAIVAMMVRRNDEQPDLLQVFARVANFSDKEVSGKTELYLDRELKDAKDLTLPPRDPKTKKPSEKAVAFDLENLDEGVLEMRLDVADSLKADNVATCVVGNVRRAKVLAVTRGNRWLELAMKTEAARQLADIEFITPDDMAKDDYIQRSTAGNFDLIVYDACSPERMPPANTLFFGAVPQVPALGETRKLIEPTIIDVNETNKLFRFVNMDNIAIIESLLPELPPGTQSLLESHLGPVAFLLMREGFWDTVIGFGFMRDTADGPKPNTNWMGRPSFPLFVFNALRVLGNVLDAISEESMLPGSTVPLRSDALADKMFVRDPSGQKHEVTRTPQGTFLFNQTEQLGSYEFGDAERVQRRFAVNLFDVRESDIAPREELQIGHNEVSGKVSSNPSRKEAWRWLLLAAFAVLLFEWYVYNRRVYI